MEISQTGLNLIKAWEGIEDGNKATVNLDPYLCPAGYWTIGWGHVVLGPNNEMLRGADLKRLAYSIYPNGITLAEAEMLLRNDCRKFEAYVNRSIKTDTTQNEFDAMVALCFNIGPGGPAKEGFTTSSVLRYHNLGQKKSPYAEVVAVDFIVNQKRRPDNAADAFLLWNKANGAFSRGLLNRRRAERALYLGT